MNKSSEPIKITVLLSSSGAGGVERMVMNLVQAFSKDLELAVDFVLIRASGPHLGEIPENVRVVPLKAKHTLLAIPELSRYLKRQKPKAILVAKDRAGRAALLARKMSGVDCRVVVRLGTNLSAALQRRSLFNRYFRTIPMRFIYRWVDKIVAVSEGVKQDTFKVAGIPLDKIQVIRNPVITQSLQAVNDLPAEPAPHEWLRQPHEQAVVMAAGRLSPQKDFQTLINAFAQLQEKLACRLIILGEGSLRHELDLQIQQLKISDRVLLPGFQVNIHQWLQKADLFVLSSRWEGSPNVLTEALALGVPVVSTRCPSGPDELLQQNDQIYGELVPMSDAEALAKAMLNTLQYPKPKAFLRQAVREYNVQHSSQAYLNVLLGRC